MEVDDGEEWDMVRKYLNDVKFPTGLGSGAHSASSVAMICVSQRDYVMAACVQPRYQHRQLVCFRP